MEQVVVKNDELLSEAKRIAKLMLNKGIEEVEKKLPGYLKENASLGVAICKELVEITKESIRCKSERQKEFIALCDKVILSCDTALKDGQISEEERLLIENRINDVLRQADESNKTFQNHKRDIAIAGIGGLTVVLGIIASSLSKTIKK